jgi:hypothetical protein
MKVRVTLKDPDGVGDCVDEAVRGSLPSEMDDEEKEAVFDTRREKVKKVLARWIEYGEYVTVEFDTDAGTAVVVPKGA